MSSPTPPEPVRSRSWTLPIVAGVVALIVVAVVCVGGSLTAYLALRKTSTSGAPPVPTPAPQTTAPTPTPAPVAPKSNADCLIGDWVETSYAGTAEIYGTRVQLTSKGALARFSPDGTTLTLFDNVVRTGQADGDTFEVVHHGQFRLNYLADETTLYYSNPQVEGTTTWKVNGKVRDSKAMGVLLAPETYKCSGNQLRIYADDYAAEYQRVVPPGTGV